jgi:deazaflavin-dependent oxidoreductase (nitroreductase family)
MTDHNEITDSPVKNVASHIRNYIETDGKKGHLYHGMPTLLLTVRGRKSGKLYRTALIYGEDAGRYLVIPSDGGADEDPSWYLNLLADPQVDVQIMDEKFAARARVATPDEKPALWDIMTRIFSTYNTYQKKSKRDIPVVILERI